MCAANSCWLEQVERLALHSPLLMQKPAKKMKSHVVPDGTLSPADVPWNKTCSSSALQ